MTDKAVVRNSDADATVINLGPLGRFVELDRAVDQAEGAGIVARWEFGREVLAERVGKQLPKGRLEEIAATIGKSITEVKYRALFASQYRSQEEVVNVVDHFKSWHEVVNTALSSKPIPPPPPAVTPGLPDGTYSTIVADPPWDIRTGPDWGSNGPSRPLEYPTMSVEDIAALPVAERAAPNAHLYLWTINAYLSETYQIARAWGFEPSTLLTWCKPRHGIGLGGTYVLTTEHVLFCRRGSLGARERVDTSWFEWPRREHSVKPVEFFEMVERVSPGPYLELFARVERSGWDVWGNEVTGDATAA